MRIVFFFQIKFHLELTHQSNSHNFPWFLLTWEEGGLRKWELCLCIVYQIHLGTLVDVEAVVHLYRKEKPPKHRDGKLLWEGRSVTLGCLFCVMKMCWCHGHSHPSLLDFVVKRGALPLCVLVKSYGRSFVPCQPAVWLQGVPSPSSQPLHKQTQQFKCWYSRWFNSSDLSVAEFQALCRLCSALHPASMYFSLYPLFPPSFSISFREAWNSGE